MSNKIVKNSIRVSLLSLAILLGTLWLWTFSGTPQAAAPIGNLDCSGSVGGASTVTTITGNVFVRAGASCTLEFVNVGGNVLVQPGGSLLIKGYSEPSTIQGNVQAVNCRSARLEGNITVKGNLQIVNCTGTAANGFQGPGIVVGGNFLCNNNAGPCQAWLGTIDGNAQIINNRGTASEVSLTEIGGNLQCVGNAVAPTHSHGYNWVTGNVQGQCGADFTTTTTSIGVPESGGMSCAALASLLPSSFPVPNTVVVSAVDTAPTATLPRRCIVVLNYNPTYVSPVSGCRYHDRMQVQLPLPSAWNGRFFHQIANVGALGNATQNLASGYAVATDNAGVDPTDMMACGDTNTRQYFADPYGALSNASQAQQITALTAKYLIAAYYGRNAGTSYTGGCSGPGGRAMMFSQTFPQYFDGIWVGAPGNNFQKNHLPQIWNMQQWMNVYLTANPPLVPPIPATVPNPQPNQARPYILYPAFPNSDRTLFQTALLQSCDALDGVADGVIDSPRQCQVTFDPATAMYVDSSGTTRPLQCVAGKNATCLSPAQIQALKGMQQGVRTSAGQPVYVPSGADAPFPADRRVYGYPYDAGWASSQGGGGMFVAFVGANPTTPPSIYQPDMGFFVYGSLGPPIPGFDPLSFNFDTDQDLLAPTMAWASVASSLDLSKFANLGHKIIFWHSTPDAQHNVAHTVSYYNGMANLFGGLNAIQSFSRLYVIPGMTHCSGGPGTDQFDELAALTQWVENGIAPDRLAATGANFTTAQYGGVTSFGFNSQPIGGAGGAPTTRSRPLCPYPQEARFTGLTTVVNGAPVASNPADLADITKYTCVVPAPPYFLQ